VSDQIGRIFVPTPVNSGLTFPLVTEYPYAETQDLEIIEHRFQDNATLGVQRFAVGSGLRRFQFSKSVLSRSERASLVSFYNSVQGSFQYFTYNAPNTDRQTTTPYSVTFDTAPLSITDLVTYCSTGLTFLEVIPTSTAPSYPINATVARFPDSTLASALTGQAQVIIPLVHIKVRDPHVPDVYLSDRRVTVGGQLYLPRLLDIGEPGSDVILVQDITPNRGTSDNVQFAFGNADRAMSAFRRDTGLMYAEIDLSLYHVQSGYLLQLWKGIIIGWQGDQTNRFSVRCSDGLYPITQEYPRRTITRQCWKLFNDGINCPYDSASSNKGLGGSPTSCDYYFNSPNGCLAHGMSLYFGGHPAFPQNVVIKDDGSGTILGFGRSTVTSTSIISDSVYGNPLPEIWCNDNGTPQQAFWANTLVAAVRDESTFEDVLGIVGVGPIGGYEGMSVQTNPDGFKFLVTPLADGFPPQGFKVDGQLNIVGYQPQLGLRQILGADPITPTTDPFSLGQGTPQRWDIPDPVFGNILTGQPHDILPFAAGTAFCEVRYSKSPGSGIAPTTAESHTLSVPLSKGLTGVKYDASGVLPTSVAGLNNPFWVAANMYWRALGLEKASSTVQLNQIILSSLVTGSGTGSAEIADLQVPALVGGGTETQFVFNGMLSTFKPFRDWLTEVLSCALGYFTFEFGRLNFGIRENASATVAFAAGNMLFQSLTLAPALAGFEYLRIDYADRALQYQDNWAEYQDKDFSSYMGRSGAPLTSKIRSVGLSSLSQGLRVCTTRVREEIGGILRPDQSNPYVEFDNNLIASWRSTILALDCACGAVAEITHPDLATYPGPVGGSPLAANTWKFRINRLELHRDWSITFTGKSVVDSMYDLDVGPKPADVKPSPVPVLFYAQPAGPMWAPYYLQAPNNDALFPSEWTFDITEDYTLLQSGAPGANVLITGKLPVNTFSPGIGAPVVGSVAQFTTGGFIPGGLTYRVAVCAVDNGPQLLGAPSAITIVQVPPGTNTNQITLNNIQWPPVSNLGGCSVFVSNQDDLICLYGNFSLSSSGTDQYTPTSLTLTGPFERSTYALPDPQTNLIRVKAKKHIHAGVIGAKVSAVGTNTITSHDLIDLSSGPFFDPTGRILSAIGRFNSSVPFQSFFITAWDHTTGTFTVTPDPHGIVAVNDAVTVRYLGSDNSTSPTQISDPGIRNQTNNYTGMTPGAEVGHILRVIQGRGRGQLRKILSNTDITFTWDTPLNLDTTSIWIIEDGGWLFSVDSTDVSNADPNHVTTITLPVANYPDQPMVFGGFTVDVYGNECPDGDIPIREGWVYGAQGTKDITSDYTQLPTDRLLLCDTSTPTHPGSTDSLAADVTTTTQTNWTFTSGMAIANGTYVTCGSESVLVESGSGPSRIVVRGSSPTTHTSGDSVTVPGYIMITCLPFAQVPNVELFIQKFTTDTNYVVIVPAMGETFGDGSTSIILSDTSATNGVAHLLFPGD
jgi:hypothetical protein